MDMVYGFYARAGSLTDMYRKLRLVACFSVAIGAALIGQLWVVWLDILSLSEAARGVLFLLVALGLAGYQRLSLVLNATPVSRCAGSSANTE